MMIRRIARTLIPRPVQILLRDRTAGIRAQWRDRSLRKRLLAQPRRVVIGASGVFEHGWIATDSHELNLLRPASWETYFEPASIDALLAEHVWEHLTLDEGESAAATCYRYLKPGGYIRVAVPDGLHPDPEYREYIKVDGVGGGGKIGGHKVVYTYLQLRKVFESAGFTTKLLEYHDEQGTAHTLDWDPAEGMIHRSRRFDPRGVISIILDATK
jgi:YD repeat-containing protein